MLQHHHVSKEHLCWLVERGGAPWGPSHERQEGPRWGIFHQGTKKKCGAIYYTGKVSVMLASNENTANAVPPPPLTLYLLVMCVLITFANSLDPDQAWQMSGLIWIQNVWLAEGIPERTFCKSSAWKKICRMMTKIIWNYSACKWFKAHISAGKIHLSPLHDQYLMVQDK